MAIQMRRGSSADFDGDKLEPGELAVCLDTNEMYFKGSEATQVATPSLIGYHAIYPKRLTGISSLPKTFSGATGITADHEPIKGSAQVSPQSAMGGDWTVTCGDGTITVSGSFVGSTAVTILMDFGIPDHEVQTLT